ncbi:hypothetical protein P3X46_024897 [Hevea brasiliensis]|uniref:Uncharacterized protein n=1 Tax=Hevea brasiliensis TaxID=3981 RepID=A0ABQ9L776_HEVBR|nr:UPF0481 protein At3g47200 [Hevea brasiliensis]XP_057990985.1 UPF0481 protein At3g47200 [Hevea brasiliensis]KAJ9159389.1 hypothetical protein P3X46_024897 [Hevea brasiliensis]
MMEKQINIDVDQVLASSIRRKLVQNSPVSAGCCIFRVPNTLRKHNEQLFEPTFISIGPYHRDIQKFQFTEKIKLWYLDCLIARAPTPETSLECFIKSIRANVKSCLECYGEEVLKLTNDEFVEIMVIDGCFIIEFFRRNANIVPKSMDDPLFKMLWVRKVLVTDFLLLENQLPWFVLECLFNLTETSHDEERRPLSQLAYNYFHRNAFKTEMIEVNQRLQNKHLLDLLRNIILRGSEDPQEKGFLPIPCVTELLQAGVDFAVGEKTSLMKITFENGILTIPPLVILDNAESFFRNLIAYEQCDRSLNDGVTAYAAFLDNLVNSSEDLEYLRQKGIIICYLSTEDVSAFFNRLYNDAHLTRYPYRKISERIVTHYQSRWPRWRAKLCRDYFNSPWAIISLIGAIIILVLTFLQTLYAMF